jgi:hypothetical protein
MKNIDFLNILLKASAAATQTAKDYVTNSIQVEYRYNVLFNQSCDTHATEWMDCYPEDEGREEINVFFREEVVEMLCRNGKIPVWIDISVVKSNSLYTTLELRCAGRYSDRPADHYYEDRGFSCFGIKSPVLPLGYKKGVKFEL